MEEVCMDLETAALKAGQYFGNGYHCAEAVVAATLEAAGQDKVQIQAAISCATAFGGGFGKSFEEACGALSGALIAIGYFHGRKTLDESWDLPARMGDDIRQAFLEQTGTTHCRTLRDRFGEEHQMAECRILVQETTRELIRILT